MSEAVIIIILIVVAVALSMLIMWPLKKIVIDRVFSNQSYLGWKIWRYVMGFVAIILFAVLVYLASLLKWITF